MPFTIIRQDITKIQVDAIVNAANTSLQMGGGVCGAIFKAAGVRELQAECDKIGGCETGQAVITRGYKLPAKFIIHTPGPVWHGGERGEEKQLRGCYIQSLKLAEQHECESIAFPLISSGIYGYPKDKALRVATDEIQAFLADHDRDVYLVVFDQAAVEVSEQLIGSVEAFIDEHYVTANTSMSRRKLHDERDESYKADVQYEDITLFEDNARYEDIAPQELSAPQIAESSASGLEEWVNRLDEPFAQTLLRLIDAKGRTDVEVYKRANIDRKLFSKIRNSNAYMPSKKTAVALAIALELNLDEAGDLLERAGYTLSRSQKFDVIIEFFIAHGKYDIFEINEVLFHYDQPLLGS